MRARLALLLAMVLVPVLAGVWSWQYLRPVGEARFAARLHARFPGSVGAQLAPAFPGFWSVSKAGEVSFIRDDLSIAVRGDVVDLRDGHSITQLVRDSTRPKVDVQLLDVADAFQIGHGSRRLYVFSDPDCPYCRQLDVELRKLTDTTVYVFPYPLVGLHANATAVAEALWCQADRAAAWSAYEAGGAAPGRGASCANPVARNVALGTRLGLVGTPSIVFADGSVVPGVIPAARIMARLDSPLGGV